MGFLIRRLTDSNKRKPTTSIDLLYYYSYGTFTITFFNYTILNKPAHKFYIDLVLKFVNYKFLVLQKKSYINTDRLNIEDKLNHHKFQIEIVDYGFKPYMHRTFPVQTL